MKAIEIISKKALEFLEDHRIKVGMKFFIIDTTDPKKYIFSNDKAQMFSDEKLTEIVKRKKRWFMYIEYSLSEIGKIKLENIEKILFDLTENKKEFLHADSTRAFLQILQTIRIAYRNE